MNWPNYDRLVAHLEAIDPATFDYTMNPVMPFPDSAGCLGYHCRVVSQVMHPVNIATFLDITAEEELYLLGARSAVEPDAPHFYEMVGGRGLARGEAGRNEALRRLEQVATIHWVAEAQKRLEGVGEGGGGEGQFLESMRTLVRKSAGAQP